MLDNYRPQRSWGKVIFSQASVILLTGGGRVWSRGGEVPASGGLVRGVPAASGTHPTGMHSCFSCFHIEIAYSNFTFCGAYTLSFLAHHTVSEKRNCLFKLYFLWCLHTQFSGTPHSFRKTSTPLVTILTNVCTYKVPVERGPMSRGWGGFLYGEIQCIIGIGHTESPLHYPPPQPQPLLESD